MTPTEKAHAYITHGRDLLVFREPDFPDLGLQVPGGTIATGETPEQAVLREVHEETGLTDVRVVSYLGDYTFNMHPHRDEIQHRHVFHLTLTAPAPQPWQHYERDASDDLPPILFEFSWASLDDPSLTLAGGQGALLHLLPVSA